MKVPIVCYTDGCQNSGELVNTVAGINPQDLDDFYEGFDESNPDDYCKECGQLGVAEDPFLEHEWETRYYENEPERASA